MIINCNGKILDVSVPAVMAVINVNIDSFYQGSRVTGIDQIIERIDTFIAQGAKIVDIGAMSSRPGAKILSHDEEWNIISPVLTEIKNANSIISIDTVWSDTALKACNVGAHIINDISGGTIDQGMLKAIGSTNMAYVMMHMRGTPQDMQTLNQYDDMILDILSFFKNQIVSADKYGIKDIIIDPGFGFAKDLDQNYTLLNALEVFKIFDRPILAGLSRKSMLYKFLDISADEALNSTTVANTIALIKGANILRVHDVTEAIQAILIKEKTYK